MSTNTKAYANLTLAMIIVGSSVVAGKFMLTELPVYLGTTLRFILASAIIIPLVLAKEGIPRLSLRSFGILFIQAACGTFLFNALLLYGLQSTSAGIAGILTSTTPACMGLTAWIILRERPTRRVLTGIACAMLGVMVVTINTSDFSAGTLSGNLLVLAAVLAESLFLLLGKALKEDVSPLTVSGLMTVFGLVLFAPMGIAEATTFDFSTISPQSWLTIGYYGAFVTVAAYLFWFSGVKKVPAGVAGTFTSVMPVSAVVLSALMLGEPITTTHLIGIMFVLSGIWFICAPRPTYPTRASSTISKSS